MATTSGRSAALRPSRTTQVVMTAGFGFFVAGGAVFLTRAVRGQLEWTTGDKIGVPLVVVLTLSCLTGLVGVWTNAVWVDHDRNELHQFVVVKDVVRRLDAPTTARLAYKRATANTVTSTWKVVLDQPGLPPLSVSTPWVRDIAEVLRILQPALARNPALPADDFTRASIERPDQLQRPR